MKLSKARNHLAAAGRGGGSHSLADHNAVRGCGLSGPVRAKSTNDNEISKHFTETPMTLDDDNATRQGYICLQRGFTMVRSSCR
jgi:hypothetical protein